MNILSLFDGISCGMYTLNKLGVTVNKYYASEIDVYASQVSQNHWPDAVRLGDVTRWREWDIDWLSIDMVIAGSPCQGFSSAGNKGGTKAIIDGVETVIDSRELYLWAKSAGAKFLSQSHLFWEFVLILDHVKSLKPDVAFMLENVKMSKNNLDMISGALGVQPVFINSALLSAQNRQRYYWCNWYVPEPQDRGLLIADILENSVGVEWDHTDKAVEYMNRVGSTGRVKWSYSFHSEVSKGKSQCVAANFHKGVPNNMLVVNSASMVGRRWNNGKRDDHNSDIKPIQTLEVNSHGKSRCLSTVSKDSLVTDLAPGKYVLRKYDRKNGLGEEIDKSIPVLAGDYRGLNRNQSQNAVCEHISVDTVRYRKFTPIECERLQGLSDDYTRGVSNTQRYIMLGNGWQCDTIEYIFFGC